MTQDSTVNPSRWLLVSGGGDTSRASFFYYLLYASVLAYFVARYILAHRYASFTFPVPWPDESAFLWQALSFKESSSLFAPQLHPARPILWMPPGYMTVTGSIFKVFGFSLGFARGLSMVFMIGAFLALIRMTLRYDLKLPSLLMCGVFFASTRFILAGNIARMEALLLFAVFTGFLLMQGGMAYKGLSLLSATPLIHPNGVYFFAAALIYLLLNRGSRNRGRKLTWHDWAFGLFAVALWGLYALYVYRHWPAFLNDMGFQLGRKGGRDILGSLLDGGTLRLLSIAVFCWAYCKLAGLEEAFLLYIAVPSLLVNSIGHELWYELFENLSYLLVSLVAIHVLYHMSKRVIVSRSFWVRFIILSVITGSVIFYNVKAGEADRPFKRPFKKNWSQMRMPAEVPYITDSDRREIEGFLASLQSENHPIYVEFFPRADALFFHDSLSEKVQFQDPIFRDDRPDVYLVHMSEYIPSWLKDLPLRRLGWTAEEFSEKSRLIRQRDSTHTWSYVLLRPDVEPGKEGGGTASRSGGGGTRR